MRTLEDVASLAGVSIPTVSRVLNNHPHVAEETRERVRKAMKELNYQPNMPARSLRTNRTNVVALMIPDIVNPYFSGVTRGVQDVAEEFGSMVILCNTDRKLIREKQYLEVLIQHQVDGLILNPAEITLEDLAGIQAAKIPAVMIGSQLDVPDFDVVMVDNVRAAYEAVEYLIDLGHRNVGIIAGSRATSSGEQRLEGYLQAVRAAGLEVEDTLIAEGDFSEQGGYRCTKRLMGQSPRPTAIFASSDVMAIGALSALRDEGFQVPKDVSLVGFDDIASASITTPRVTTMSQPKYGSGEVAAHLLFERIEGDGPQRRRRVILNHELVVRDSTCALPSAERSGDG